MMFMGNHVVFPDVSGVIHGFRDKGAKGGTILAKCETSRKFVSFSKLGVDTKQPIAVAWRPDSKADCGLSQNSPTSMQLTHSDR